VHFREAVSHRLRPRNYVPGEHDTKVGYCQASGSLEEMLQLFARAKGARVTDQGLSSTPCVLRNASRWAESRGNESGSMPLYSTRQRDSGTTPSKDGREASRVDLLTKKRRDGWRRPANAQVQKSRVIVKCTLTAMGRLQSRASIAQPGRYPVRCNGSAEWSAF